LPDELERRVFDAVRRHACEGGLPAASLTVGLDVSEFGALSGHVFQGAGDAADVQAPPTDERPAMLSPLIAMLWAHRTGDAPWTRLMAGTISCAAFGARHLWQDLGAAGRPEVTALLERHFRTLAARNVRNLKWKHHLFQCLGAQLGLSDLRPPRCDGCEEQPLCFPDQPITVRFGSLHGGTKAKQEKAA